MRYLLLLPLLILAACDQDTGNKLPTQALTIELRGKEPKRIMVEIADDDMERATGLMNRSYLPEDRGMLFVFPESAQRQFWMHHTLIPLDMLFINTQGVILHIERNARPNDDTPISSRFPVNQVLEINAGLANRWGLKEGDSVTLDKPLDNGEGIN